MCNTSAMKRAWHLLLLLAVFAMRAQAVPGDVVLQSTPSDCGPAALATLLDRYLDIRTTEAEMVKLTGVVPEYGSTLLQLEKAATQKGCAADSFRMDWKTLQEQVASYPCPVIVRTLNPEPHFSLLLGVQGGSVFLADPAAGHIMLTEKAFLKRFIIPTTTTGYVFIAAGPEGVLNHERRTRVLKEFEDRLQTLQTFRAPLPAFRR